MEIIGGIDIGGTKCAVSIAELGSPPRILDKRKIETMHSPTETLSKLGMLLQELLAGYPDADLKAIGISCGGPLNAEQGLILSPPNLPGWDQIDCICPFQDLFHVPVSLQNDADACALAEWKWGAGQGCKHMIFLTFGTGMGAGLILNGQLYTGACNMAGEIGHVRFAKEGPVGYGKTGSFEGFCSGGGIARLGQKMALDALQQGNPPSFCPDLSLLQQVTAKSIGEAAQQEDPLALSVFHTSGRFLGYGLSILIDLLNPERIVIGSIYGRQQTLLESEMRSILEKECLSRSLNACTIVPAGLGEQIGDYASLSVASYALMNLHT